MHIFEVKKKYGGNKLHIEFRSPITTISQYPQINRALYGVKNPLNNIENNHKYIVKFEKILVGSNLFYKEGGK